MKAPALAGALLATAVALSQSASPLAWTAAEDHRHMLNQLGIKALRPGPSGNEAAPNHANYDEATANPFPDYPEILRLANGQPVTTADAWWKQRRPQILAAFEQEVVGRVPANAPRITWTVQQTVQDRVGPYPVVARSLVGYAHKAGINVDIQLVVVTPAWIKQPVPLMMMFGRAALPSAPVPPAFARFAAAAGTDPPATLQLIASGWGYALLTPASIQADNGAGLRQGVIGLANQGEPRKPEDWGSLRAWAWGASRALDYLETDLTVDAKRVGIEGVSRYGKAALVTMAFDQRFALVLVGSSGEGGVSPYRRNFGEAVENLTGTGQYHWMAGSFLKYGAAESSFGSMNAGDLPVDAHQLIALCAPRPTFISYGIPEKGDARWLDQQGSFMATVAAGSVFRLLGAQDLGVAVDYRTVKMPPVNTNLLAGQLAWRQHDGGHTDGPNWKYFIPWANRMVKYTPPAAPAVPPHVAVPRLDANSLVAHAQLLDKAKRGGIGVYFVGDSITRRWGATDYPHFLANWKSNFFGWHAANFGWGADRIQNILWRMQNGELDGVNPNVVVLQAGTNNLGTSSAGEIVEGLRTLVAAVRLKAPDATIILTGLFPRNDQATAWPVIQQVNGELAKMTSAPKLRYLDINGQLADAQGRLLSGMTNPDQLHLAEKGYQVWADALKPILQELLGPPSTEDHAPPPTGDPSGRH